MRSKNKTLQYSAGLCVPSAWEWTQVVRLLSQGMLQFVTTKIFRSVQGSCAICLKILSSLIVIFILIVGKYALPNQQSTRWTLSHC